MTLRKYVSNLYIWIIVLFFLSKTLKSQSVIKNSTYGYNIKNVTRWWLRTKLVSTYKMYNTRSKKALLWSTNCSNTIVSNFECDFEPFGFHTVDVLNNISTKTVFVRTLNTGFVIVPFVFRVFGRRSQQSVLAAHVRLTPFEETKWCIIKINKYFVYML